MSKILITGNGFDLFHHLPTKYHHFISIMQTIEGNHYDTDVSFDELFGRVFKIKHQYEYKSIEENYNTASIKFSYEKLNSIKKLLETNLWYKHFKNVTEIETWIDFESEIENVLIQMSSIIKHSEENRTIYTSFNNRELNIYIDFSEFGLCRKNDSENSYFDEDNINPRTGKFDAKKALDKMIKSFDEFITIFNVYLSHVTMLFYDNYKGEIKIPIHYVDFFYSFNYTPTLEKIYNKNIHVVYLHGETNSDNSIQNIVLGVDEIPNEMILNKAFEFSKYYQKIVKRSNDRLLGIPNKETNISEEHVFYIFGHSLDKSDKGYIKHIFSFLENDYTDSSNLVVFYYDDNDYKSKVKNLFSFMEKDIIVDLNESGRLVFVEINKVNLEREFGRKLWQKYGEDYIV